MRIRYRVGAVTPAHCDSRACIPAGPEPAVAPRRQVEEGLRHQVADLQRQVSELDQMVIVNRDRLVLEEVGLFRFRASCRGIRC